MPWQIERRDIFRTALSNQIMNTQEPHQQAGGLNFQTEVIYVELFLRGS